MVHRTYRNMPLDVNTYHNCLYFSLLAAAFPCLNLEVLENINIWLLPHYKHMYKPAFSIPQMLALVSTTNN
jgi:hypothetical protein